MARARFTEAAEQEEINANLDKEKVHHEVQDLAK